MSYLNSNSVRAALFLIAFSPQLLAESFYQKRIFDNFSFIDAKTLLCKRGNIQIEHTKEKEHSSSLKVEGIKSPQVTKLIARGSILAKAHTGIHISSKSPFNNAGLIGLIGKDNKGKPFQYTHRITLAQNWADVFISFDDFKSEEDEAINKSDLGNVTAITFTFTKQSTEESKTIAAYLDDLFVSSQQTKQGSP